MDVTLIIVIVVASLALSLLLPRFLLPRLTGARKRQQLVAKGKQARAVITSLDQTGTYINEQPKCRIGLRVEPKDGAPFDAVATQVVLLTQIPQFQPGGVVTVRYDPANPSDIAIESLGHVGITQDEAQALIAQSEAVRQRLVSAGTPASAIVTSFEPTGVNVNGDNPLARVGVKVMPTGGAPFDGTIVGVFAKQGLHKYQPGKTVHVRYDPTDTTQLSFDQPAAGA